MLNPELLAILRCPETHQTLANASREIVAALNQQISVGTAKNRGGEKVTEAINGGLLREDKKILYPIRNGLPILLIDAAFSV
jgi:uncharacterized protein YbaR (Trm112 family)